MSTKTECFLAYESPIAKALEGATQGLDLIRTYNAKDC
jgi:hypothetical protein|nr:MAG TPA: Transcription elongation factor, GreA/GreB, C-term [Caudoviricetes sp.]